MTRLNLNRAEIRLLQLLMVMGLVAAGAGGACAQSPPHLAAAKDLVAHVRHADSTYRHKDGAVKWAGRNGATKYECHTDCSGLLNHLLEYSYGVTRDQFRGWLGTERPKASTYCQAIAEANGFQQVARINQVQPGDIVAIKYPPGSGNTGHVMIVIRAPQPRSSSAPEVPGSTQWEVAVIDSSSSKHGRGDTRDNPGGRSYQGLGAGVFRIYSDSQGRIVGHSWSTSRKSEFRDQRMEHLVIGRLITR